MVGTATNADRSDYTVTEVRYAPGSKPKAQFLLSELGGAGKVVALIGERTGGSEHRLGAGPRLQRPHPPDREADAEPDPTATSGRSLRERPRRPPAIVVACSRLLSRGSGLLSLF